MALLPTDVREALGVDEADARWVRLRSSLGSIVGETFLIARGQSVRVAMRSSALADLEELELSGPVRFEEDSHDASLVLVRGTEESRVTVGYLERDEVRTFFETLAAEAAIAREAREAPAADPAPDAPTAPAAPETSAAAEARALEALRSAFLEVLRERTRARREHAKKKRAQRGAAKTVAVVLAAQTAIDDICRRTQRLDERIGRLRKRRADFDDPSDQELFDYAIAATRQELAAEKATFEQKKERSKRARSAPEPAIRAKYVVYLIVLGVLGFVLWQLSR